MRIVMVMVIVMVIVMGMTDNEVWTGLVTDLDT